MTTWGERTTTLLINLESSTAGLVTLVIAFWLFGLNSDKVKKVFCLIALAGNSILTPLFL